MTPTSPTWQWNIEQATRRALRSLERRGLVESATYSYRYDDADHVWDCCDPEKHVPGQHRWMIGVLLTDKGRALVEKPDSD
jgi:hypothetical protein